MRLDLDMTGAVITIREKITLNSVFNMRFSRM